MLNPIEKQLKVLCNPIVKEKNMRERYLTTGAFAGLCRTTKETLFHYDRIGLLKPRHVSENGYRRYAAEQFFEFDMIQVLKEAGSSLEEIRGYMNSYEPRSFLSILGAKRERLERERERLAERIAGLARIEEATRAALAAEYGSVSLETLPEERLVVTPVAAPALTWGATALHFRRHFDRCARVGLKAVFPLGVIIKGDDLLRGEFGESWCFSTAGGGCGEKTAGETGPEADFFMRKPAGMYAVTLHKGSYESLYLAVPAFLREVARRGFAPSGHAYIYELLSYLATASEDDDVQRLEVPVCADAKRKR